MKHLFQLFVVLLFLLVAMPASARVYLVAVGISDYAGTENDLNCPVRNANSIADVYLKQDPNMVCTRIFNEQATTENILLTVSRVFSHADTNDIIVLFIGGHGYTGGYMTYDGYLDYGRLRQAMAASRSRHKIIFADTCHSGTLRSEKKSRKNRKLSARFSDVMLFLSSRNDEYSWEGGAINMGHFSYYLSKGLGGAADADGNNIITAREIFKYVNSSVADFSGGKQHPVMWGKFSDDMPVVYLK